MLSSWILLRNWQKKLLEKWLIFLYLHVIEKYGENILRKIGENC